MAYLPIADKTDAIFQRQSIDGLGIQNHIELDDVSQFPSPATKAVVNNASVLMAVGSSNASGRKTLFLKNTGEGVALVNGANSGGGRRLLPDDTLLFRFTGETEVSIYARAETISTEIYIEET